MTILIEPLCALDDRPGPYTRHAALLLDVQDIVTEPPVLTLVAVELILAVGCGITGHSTGGVVVAVVVVVVTTGFGLTVIFLVQ